jgi:cysteine desulfurase
MGLHAKKAVEEARASVADLINAEASEIIFTSGSTEGLNIALKGYYQANSHHGNHIITIKTEHKAVLDTCRYLESVGCQVTYLGVDSQGLVSLDDLREAIRKDTLLICVMLVNNETGVIQPIKKIAKVAHEYNIPFLCDATQAIGKMDVDVSDLGIDMLALSAHKFYGPKGVGALYIRKSYKGKLYPLIQGGGQEKGLRSGTLNVPGIAGLGAAARLTKTEIGLSSNIAILRERLETKLLSFPGAYVNGDSNNRISSVSNICFPGILADVVMGRMPMVAVSNGSACTSAIVEASHVLKAMGLTEDDALSSIRFSLSKYTTESEVGQLLNIVSQQLNVILSSQNLISN